MKSFRRRISAFAVAIMIVPLFPVTASAIGTFDDDDGVPGEVHIERLAELGAIEGCDPPANQMSCPERELSKAEAFKILVVAGQTYDVLPSHPRRAGRSVHRRR